MSVVNKVNVYKGAGLQGTMFSCHSGACVHDGLHFLL